MDGWALCAQSSKGPWLIYCGDSKMQIMIRGKRRVGVTQRSLGHFVVQTRTKQMRKMQSGQRYNWVCSLQRARLANMGELEEAIERLKRNDPTLTELR